jgi:S1-C subfamily serine protease
MAPTKWWYATMAKIVEYKAIIGVDADKDILILKITDHTFPSIAIGNSDLLNVGQKIYAISSPMGFDLISFI